jgi:hypothetical protein
MGLFNSGNLPKLVIKMFLLLLQSKLGTKLGLFYIYFREYSLNKSFAK